tara:strand:- start:508 stop:1278 length:771 start_codon:yes stop_codon:yes gene_type:complete
MIITSTQLLVFFLIFIRLLTMIRLMPIFSNNDILAMYKVFFAVWVSILMIFYVPLPLQFPQTGFALVFIMLNEMLIGAILAFVAQIFIYGIEFAGSLMDTQAGISVAQTLDPASGQNTTLIYKILRQVSIIVLMLINGHHVFLGILLTSFITVPVGTPFDLSKAALFATELGGTVFEVALQFSAPILLVVFMVDFGFGMLSRVAPQVNVFQLGFQIKPSISLFVLLSIIPVFLGLLTFLLEKVSEDMLRTMYLMKL